MFSLPESLGLVIIADKDDGEVTDYIIVPTSYVNEVYDLIEEYDEVHSKWCEENDQDFYYEGIFDKLNAHKIPYQRVGYRKTYNL